MRVPLDTLEGVITTVIAGAFSLWIWLFRRHSKRIDDLEIQLIKNKLSIEKHPTESEIKSIITDKIEPIYIYIKEMKEDLKEIKQDIKHIR